MKTLAFFILFNLFSPSANWLTDFEKAKTLATQNHKYILLNFSGSDWCVHCMRLEKEIFETSVFTDYANKSLILVQADFPRKKKHKLDAEQIKRNEALAEKYDKKGVYPVTLLFDENGNVLKEWEGSPADTPEEFVRELNSLMNVKH